MIVLFVLQMHLQKEPGVEVRAVREGWTKARQRRERSSKGGRDRGRMVRWGLWHSEVADNPEWILVFGGRR